MIKNNICIHCHYQLEEMYETHAGHHQQIGQPRKNILQNIHYAHILKFPVQYLI